MKLRGKTISIVLLTFIVLFLTLFLVSREIIIKSFTALEEQDVTKNTNRVMDAIKDDLENISLRNKDYASWDQTYSFMDRKDEDYIKSELSDDTFSNIKINMLIMVDNDHQLIFAKGFNIDEGKEVLLKASEFKALGDIGESISKGKQNDQEGIQGIVNIDGKPMLITSRKILTSDGTGPSKGYMIMGRYLDSREINYIKKLTHVDFDVLNVKLLENITFENGDDKQVVVKPIDMTSIAGYSLIKDVNGNSVFFIKMTQERMILHHGLTSIRYLGLSLIITFLVFLAAVMIIIERLVLIRLLRLNREVNHIREKEEFSLRVGAQGKDELSSLALSVNELLETIEDSMNTLKENNAKLKELDKLKNEFVSTVSHELRTPLTSIIGFAKLMKKKFTNNLLPLLDLENEKIKKTCMQLGSNTDIIISEGERLTSIVNDMLDISKIESGSTSWKEEAVSMEEIINQSIAATMSIIESKGLEVIKDIEEGIPKITADKDKISQVVINLISNAVKFTDTGSITCRAVMWENEITVSVEDTGIGIAEEYYGLVFEKFKQIGDSLIGKPKGTGLGLPICKSIIEYYGGRIWVESNIGKGSKFSFTLPII